MQPSFLFFDLGNVLCRFSHERMARQMAEAAGIAPERAWQILFDEGLEWAYERGELTPEAFHAAFCQRAGANVPADRLEAAGNDIFELNVPIVALLGNLSLAGCRMGVLSNTSPSHWRHCTERFAILNTQFALHVLSYECGAIKPDRKIFECAVQRVGLPPERLFFVDDRPDNVAAAAAAGWDAVVYHSVSQLNEALRSRGIVTNF